MTDTATEQTWRLEDQETGEEVEWTRDQILEEINRDRGSDWPVYGESDPWMHALEHWTSWRFLPIYRLRIAQDDPPEPPRWDPITKFATWCDRYTIGDEQPDLDPSEWLISQLSEELQGEWERFMDEDMPSIPSAALSRRLWSEWNAECDRLQKGKALELAGKEFHVLPVYAYVHSGITISTGSFSCPWDSGQIGWIILSKELAAKELGPDADPLEFMRTEIQAYDTYLQGDVWGYIVEKKLGDGDWEEEDSCWGFYGSEVDELRPYMEHNIGHNIEQEFADEQWQASWDDRKLGY